MRFEDYVVAHGPSLIRLATALTGDPHRAEDLTQGVLANAYRRWRKVAAANNPEAYVRRMLVNAHADWHRRRSSTERPTNISAMQDHLNETEPDPADAVVDRDYLRSMVASLPPRARTVLVLRYYADMGDQAIADALGVSTSTVRATASRALSTLRTQSSRTL